MSILSKKKNIYSQNGEDGIIEYIFNTIGIENGNFIEFGAWDGIHLSNTYNLFKKGWGGIYIEGDSNKYNKLVYNFNSFDRITCLNKMVGFKDNDNLDLIVDESLHNKKEFDFVSIDVDGLDFFIFENFNKYLPKVVCIEVNAGHSPLYNELIEEKYAKNNIGQSLQIINNAAIKKDYFPLCYTGNLFLIKNEYKHLFNSDIKDLKEIYIDFLNNLDSTNPGGLKHLYNTFIVNKVYNNFTFDNEILKQYFEKK